MSDSVIVSDSATIGIIMGSDSDLGIMQSAIDILKEFEIDFELHIISAHRTPNAMYDYGTYAKSRGIKVIIAGAGGAAHLPGMTASLTTLPVIGVPVPSNNLDGMDSLLSIVQMPKGVPVATVAIGNSANAAYLALRILAVSDKQIADQLENFAITQREVVIGKDKEIQNN
ncbi:MAG: 5-(carboxyamino)imidazole ribonucleotide mutase [Acidimicrobiia bacterium]|jgi:phosphoribosylaminoimidazole carboxylase PurE protein|nr:5-(carboxyamino)imidazole ribonucleotide mutase [Acidimicrobiia bacterium]